jgi:magnesium-transporting ATPase (P-type)
MDQDSFQENLYLNRSGINVEKLIKERKVAKLWIFLAALGIFFGVSASVVFLAQFKLIATPLLAFSSAVIAVLLVYIHTQFLRDYWQIWTYQLKYWYLLSLVLLAICLPMFIACITLGVYNKQKLSADSWYITSIWVFMCAKWSFSLFHCTKKYRRMFTRYSLIGGDCDVIDSE